MEREIKFEYIFKIPTREGWEYNKVQLTLEQIENNKGLELSKSVYFIAKRQFTGIKDKNGKEIYEGDIIKGGMFKAFKVGWDIEDNGWNVKIQYNLKHYEIIGNIHENQELLN